MKHKFLLLLAAIVLFSAVSVSHAAENVRIGENASVVADQPPRKNVFARLWELEKRKNAAILRFFGLKK